MPQASDREPEFQQLVTRQRAELRQGELISEKLAPAEPGKRPSDDEIDEKYSRGEIRIVTEQARYPLESVTDLLDSGNYKLDPDYQRRHRWSRVQQSRLIESFIMNVPVPPVFLYEWDYNQYEVMDGLQRMTAVREFYANKFELTGLEYWKELDGLNYDALPKKIRAGINRRYLSSIILLKETSHGAEEPDILKRFVFGRINTGGVHLSPQELRNALYDGPMNRLCKELARTPALRRLWQIPVDVESLVDSDQPSGDEYDEIEEAGLAEIADRSQGEAAEIPPAWRDMTDVELVLRFFANRQRMIEYRSSIKDYLDEYLQAANTFEEEVIEELRSIFLRTLDLAEKIFGDKAFRRTRRESWTAVPSKSIYDACMNVLSRLLGDADVLVGKRDAIVEGLAGFYSMNSSVFNLRGQTRADVMRREILFEEYLRSFMAA
ncbi:DUF262 domain-containing protein [Amycolatopsis mongoliensis]|uniref:DUF262 domain-containing protein n=1 Tax=Amycolatopsis mongoliensis TaxID=715475 RepID=A0A9Y2JSE4_9PSEU|nr:DUF262 domain-containing protein [Amycolatopsis sp. 4-36]WIY02811.1 DUF262 domain-containing protein [Amycolatopsis sp. 4-36]